MHPVIFRDGDAGVDFVTMSTRTSDKKETIGSVEYSVIPIEVSSASHPFYTGEDTIIDSTGRVEKFKIRAEKKVPQGKKQRKSTVQQINRKIDIHAKRTDGRSGVRAKVGATAAGSGATATAAKGDTPKQPDGKKRGDPAAVTGAATAGATAAGGVSKQPDGKTDKSPAPGDTPKQPDGKKGNGH